MVVTTARRGWCHPRFRDRVLPRDIDEFALLAGFLPPHEKLGTAREAVSLLLVREPAGESRSRGVDAPDCAVDPGKDGFGRQVD